MSMDDGIRALLNTIAAQFKSRQPKRTVYGSAAETTTLTGNHILQPTTKRVQYRIWGAGGSGGGGPLVSSGTACSGGAGGGGGAYTEGWLDALDLAQYMSAGIPYQVGVGGAAVANKSNSTQGVGTVGNAGTPSYLGATSTSLSAFAGGGGGGAGGGIGGNASAGALANANFWPSSSQAGGVGISGGAGSSLTNVAGGAGAGGGAGGGISTAPAAQVGGQGGYPNSTPVVNNGGINTARSGGNGVSYFGSLVGLPKIAGQGGGGGASTVTDSSAPGSGGNGGFPASGGGGGGSALTTNTVQGGTSGKGANGAIEIVEYSY